MIGKPVTLWLPLQLVPKGEILIRVEALDFGIPDNDGVVSSLRIHEVSDYSSKSFLSKQIDAIGNIGSMGVKGVQEVVSVGVNSVNKGVSLISSVNNLIGDVLNVPIPQIMSIAKTQSEPVIKPDNSCQIKISDDKVKQSPVQVIDNSKTIEKPKTSDPETISLSNSAGNVKNEITPLPSLPSSLTGVNEIVNVPIVLQNSNKASATRVPVEKEGVLERISASLLKKVSNNGSLHRYCVLKPDTISVYRTLKEYNSSGSPVETFYLKKCNIGVQKKNNSFVIVEGKTPHVFKCASEEELQVWLSLVYNNIVCCIQNK